MTAGNGLPVRHESAQGSESLPLTMLNLVRLAQSRILEGADALTALVGACFKVICIHLYQYSMSRDGKLERDPKGH